MFRKRKKDSSTLRCWPAILKHLGIFSSSGYPTLCLGLMSAEGITKDLLLLNADEKKVLLLNADEKKVGFRAVFCLDSPELVRVVT